MLRLAIRQARRLPVRQLSSVSTPLITQGKDDSHYPEVKVQNLRPCSLPVADGHPLSMSHLPVGVHSIHGIVAAIGDFFIPLDVVAQQGALGVSSEIQFALSASDLGQLIKLGPNASKELFVSTQNLLDPETSSLTPVELKKLATTLNMEDLLEPVTLSALFDGYAFLDHAKKLSQIMRGVDLPPANWFHTPVVYAGSAASCTSKSDVVIPQGQFLIKPDTVTTGEEPRLDIELEMTGFWWVNNEQAIDVAAPEASPAYFSMMNDISARANQGFTGQPLGPSTSKGFQTTIGKMLTPAAALEPFLVGPQQRYVELQPHLEHPKNEQVHRLGMGAAILPRDSDAPLIIGKPVGTSYWSFPQMVANLTKGGLPLSTQLGPTTMGSGTISVVDGDTEERGCLVEKTNAGKTPITYQNKDGEKASMTFLRPGDSTVLWGGGKLVDPDGNIQVVGLLPVFNTYLENPLPAGGKEVKLD